MKIYLFLSLFISSFRSQKVSGSEALDGRFVGGTAIDRDLFSHAMTADRLRQEPLGGLLVALLGEEKVDRLARFITFHRI